MDKKAFQNIQKKLGLTNKMVSETLDVEFFTVRQWASGIWEVPRPIAKFLRTLLSAKRDNEAIYVAGYDRGQRAGYEEGRHSTGYTGGYEAGYKAAMNTTRLKMGLWKD